MQTITMYVAAAETLGVVRDSANAKNMAAPTLVRGCAVTLKMRLFADVNTDVPYPLAAFSGVTGWQFVMDDDFNATSAAKLVADNEDITVETVTVGGVTYTEFTIPITEMNTDELEKWLRVDPNDASKGHVESKSGLNAELVGYDGAEHVFVLQIKGLTVRSRIVSLEDPTPIHPEYYTAAEVDALLAEVLPQARMDDGARLVGNTSGAEWVFGEDNTPLSTSSIMFEDGVLYTADIDGATGIDFYYGAEMEMYDQNFGLRVTQGATPGSLELTCNGDSVWWGNDDSPPHYAADNTPPDISTASRAYMIRLHWDAVGHHLLANLAYTEDI